MNVSEIAEKLGDLAARMKDVEGEVAEIKPRLSVVERIVWGLGGVLATVSFIVGFASDFIRKKIGLG